MEHTGRFGTKLEAKTMDLMTKNVITRPALISDAQFATDMSQIMGWWAENIKPAILLDGKGWPGYDCILYQVLVMQDCIEVEYDENYRGGDYTGVGQKVMIPVSLIDELGNISTDNVGIAFSKMTRLHPIHIVHYSSYAVEAAIPEKT